MKIIYTGAEYHLSAFLNAIKIPMVILLASILLITFMQVMAECKPFKESLIGKHWKLYIFFVLLVSMYVPLVWK